METETEKKLREFFSAGLKFEQKNHENINLAYLFGSYAKGRITPLSDVDVGVLLDDKIDPKVYFDIQLDLSDQLSSYLNKEVEVVILNRADPRLSYQVMKYGKIVFEKDRNLKADFERKALNIYFDLKPMFDFYEKKLLERIKEGRFGKTYRGSRNSSALRVAQGGELVEPQRLEDYLKSLKEHQKATQDELEDSDVLLTYVERKLQLAAQVSIDLGNHLISSFGFETPKDYKDIFEILAKEGVISKDLCSNMKKIAGFRNILVHDYLSIDVGKVADVLQYGLGDLEDFSTAIVEFFEKRG